MQKVHFSIDYPQLQDRALPWNITKFGREPARYFLHTEMNICIPRCFHKRLCCFNLFKTIRLPRTTVHNFQYYLTGQNAAERSVNSLNLTVQWYAHNKCLMLVCYIMSMLDIQRFAHPKFAYDMRHAIFSEYLPIQQTTSFFLQK